MLNSPATSPRDGDGAVQNRQARIYTSSLTEMGRSCAAGLPFRQPRSRHCRRRSQGAGRADRIELWDELRRALALDRSVYPLTAPVRVPSSAFGSDVIRAIALSSFWFPFSTTTHRMPQIMADPAGGRSEALDLSSSNERFKLFSQPLKRLLAQVKKARPFLILHWRCGPAAAGQIAPGSRSPSRLRWSRPQRKPKGE